MSFWKKLFGVTGPQGASPSPGQLSQPEILKLSPRSTSVDDLWLGSIVSETEEDVRDPVGLSQKDGMQNAAANAMGYLAHGHIRFLVNNGRIVGVWIENLPANARKRDFLAMCCSVRKEIPGDNAGLEGLDDACSAARMGRFEIYRDSKDGGFNVRFLYA